MALRFSQAKFGILSPTFEVLRSQVRVIATSILLSPFIVPSMWNSLAGDECYMTAIGPENIVCISDREV